MRNTFGQSMAWLHTWAGLIVGWLLFAIFLGGTLACFDKELDYWMRPALQETTSTTVSLDRAMLTLRQLAPHAETLYLRPPGTRDPSIHGLAFEPGKPYIDVAMRASDGKLLPDTVGGNFFFVLHYNLEAGTPGVYVVGLAGMLMLLALISGVIIHRRIFRDFFMFRPQANGQRAWLDGHNLTGVLGLPFHLMIAYSGVMIMFGSYMFAGQQLAYRGDMAKYYEALSGVPHPRELHRPPARIAPLDPLLADAMRRLAGPAEYLEIEHVHDASIRISVLAAGNDDVAGGRRTLVYDGVDGRFIAEGAGPPTAYRTYQFISGLHRVQFGGAAFRWLYFVLGAAGCVMLASGLRLWLEKRSKQAAAAGLHSGYGLVRALNVGVIAGMPLASAALLWINRLLPASLMERGSWEARGFCTVWIAAALWSAMRLRRGNPWRDLFAGSAALLIGLPLMNALTAPGSSLLHSLRDHDHVLASVDISGFFLGLVFAWLAWMAGRTPKPRSSSSRHRERSVAPAA